MIQQSSVGLLVTYLQISFATCSTSSAGDDTNCAATSWGIGLSRLHRLLFVLAVSDGLSSDPSIS